MTIARSFALLMLWSHWTFGREIAFWKDNIDHSIYGAYGEQFRLDPAISANGNNRRLEEESGLDCFEALIFADVDFDRRVNTTEYITFLNLVGPPNFLPDSITEFNELPRVLQSNFIILACLCQQEPDADPRCCVGDAAFISNAGAAPDETPTSEQRQSLGQICFLTETSISKFLETLVPTQPPETDPPTVAPVVAETAVPTMSPSPSPSEAPVDALTEEPSLAPTGFSTILAPSPAPTRSPTRQPSRGPTFSPTISPSALETAVPEPSTPAPVTDGPTLEGDTLPPSTTPAPTTQIPTAPLFPIESPAPTPSLAPAFNDTLAPSSSLPPNATEIPTSTPRPTITGGPTNPPTGAPTITPGPTAISTSTPSPTTTPQPTVTPVDIVAQVTYIIAVEGDATQNDYREDLINAMNLLADQVAANFTRGGRRLRARSLQLTDLSVFLPTSLDGVIPTVCPRGVSGNDRCEDVSASVGLYLEGTSFNASQTRVDFEEELNRGINSGALQTFLDLWNPNSPVYIVSSLDDNGTDPDRGIGGRASEGLSGGAISGIVLGSMALILTMCLLSRRGGSEEEEEYYLKDNLQSHHIDECDEGNIDQTANIPPEEKVEANEENVMGSALAAGAVVGATGAAIAMTMPREDEEPANGDDPSTAGRQDSDAGDSGWSSREGTMSSVEDESKTDRGTIRSSQEDPSLHHTSSSYSESGLQLTYSELDEAIQKGDWAAVGVTAALLASQSQDDSRSAPDKLNVADLDPLRAAELDSLVAAGDWAGVVAAAAKYDAQESTAQSVKSTGQASEAASSGLSVGSTRTGSSGYSGSGTAVTGASGAFASTGTTGSDGRSRAEKLDEIRREVEMLVRKVVPEEKDNVDEMMMQFRGREEELVETLRTMQEREVAQKARVEGQKRAKRDAKQKAELKKLTNQSLGTAVAFDSAADATDDSWMQEIESTTPSEPQDHLVDTSSPKRDSEDPTTIAEERKPAAVEDDNDDDDTLEKMQDEMNKAIDTEDWDKVAQTAAGLSGKLADEAENDASTQSTDHSQKINELVDKGDWDGVVAAASKYADVEKSDSTEDSKEREERRAKREQRFKEEQEALEQADIWKAIAEQTKQTDTDEAESEANQAATVAADWAIARSLSELKAADKSGRLSDKGSDSGSESNSDDSAQKEV